MMTNIGKSLLPEHEGQSLVGAASATFIAVVIVASLFLGRDLFVPLSLALLLVLS